ncbi:24783_t:CDS:2, partial [Gigaspora margarita]
DKSKVMDYLNKLNNFDVPDVAEIAVKNGLYEGAFNIYKKHDKNTNAINVLIGHIEVWNRLAKAQIEGLRIKDTIDISSRAGKHEDLVKYLQMCRKKLCKPVVDSELLFAYAKTERFELSYDDGLYAAAKILFQSISNWARLASTLVHLGEYQTVVNSARRPAHKEFHLAHICGLSLIVHTEELQTNNKAVNEAYNDILIEEDYKSLRDSIDSLHF